MTIQGRLRRRHRFIKALLAAGHLVNRTAIEPFVRRRKRRAAIAALSALDDAILEDIGIARYEIAGVVDGWVVPGGRTVRTPPASKALPARHPAPRMREAA